MYISILFLVELILFTSFKKRYLNIFLAINIFLLFSATILYNIRGNWVAVILSVVFLVIIFKITPDLKKEYGLLKKILYILIIILALILIFLYFSNSSLWVKVKKEFFSFFNILFIDTKTLIEKNYNPEVNAMWRLITWKEMIKEVMDKPLLGFGFGEKFISKETLDLGWKTGTIDGWVESHNYLISFLFRSGFFGLIIFLVIIFKWFKIVINFLRTSKNKYLKILIISLSTSLFYIMILGLFEVVLEVPYGAIFFWSIMGLALAVINNCRKFENNGNSTIQ
ncbi:hypothetical protein ES708_08923 [subsurface metagenome]